MGHEPGPALGAALHGDVGADGELPLVTEGRHHGVRHAHLRTGVRDRTGVAGLIRPRVIHRMERRGVDDDDSASRCSRHARDDTVTGDGTIGEGHDRGRHTAPQDRAVGKNGAIRP